MSRRALLLAAGATRTDPAVFHAWTLHRDRWVTTASGASTSGIHAVDNKVIDADQKRTTTVEEAFLNGADYIVVGRPIKEAPDPLLAAQDIRRRIAGLFT